MVYLLSLAVGLKLPKKRAILLESVALASFAGVCVSRGINAESLILALSMAALLLSAYTDVISFKIYNRVIAFIALLAVIDLFRLSSAEILFDRLAACIAIGGFFGVLTFFSYMGGGDFKLMSSLGLLLGVRGVLTVTAVSFTCAAVFITAALALKKRSPRDKVFLAPFVTLGTFLYLTLGPLFLNIF